MGLRRIAAAVAAATLIAAGCGGEQRAGRAPADPRAQAPVPWRPDGALDRVQRARALAARAARRRAELERLAGVHTVPAALRRALLSRAIGERAHAGYRAAYRGARLAAGRLEGARGAEQAAALGAVERLAAAGLLTPSRLRPAFLNLRRNTRMWTRAPFPVAGERRSFGRHPAVFQYVPGQGMQLHPLASWGRVNARLRRCLLTRGAACPERRMRRQVDALARLGARRGGFLAWEYQYAYAQGTPPWISGMAQATAVQALSRAAHALDAARYTRVARRALGAFEAPPPTGVAVPAAAGTRYVMYSFAPPLQILNGELQAINGLRDAAVLGRSARAERLVRRGDAAARAALGGFDTGAWSLYSAAGAESTLSYHQLTTSILVELCRRTERAAYCGAARRFARYEREPPQIRIAPLRGLRARRGSSLRFSLSKGAAVQVRVTAAGGVVLSHDGQLARGDHALGWMPAARGRYRVRISARGPEGRVGVARTRVRVVLPRPRSPRAPRPGLVGEAVDPGLRQPRRRG